MAFIFSRRSLYSQLDEFSSSQHSYCLPSTEYRIYRSGYNTVITNKDRLWVYMLCVYVMCIIIALSRWGRLAHVCVNNLTTIRSDNGLSPGRRKAIIQNNAMILLIRPLGTKFGEISIGIQTSSLTKIRLKVSSVKWCPICLGLNVLTYWDLVMHLCANALGHHWFS